MNNREYKDDLILLKETEEGFMYCRYLCEEIDIEVAKKVLKNRLDFFAGKSYKVILEGSSVKRFTSEARKYLGSTEGQALIEKAAIIQNSPLLAMISNFFLLVIKQNIPVKIVTNYRDALSFLKE